MSFYGSGWHTNKDITDRRKHQMTHQGPWKLEVFGSGTRER